jgi:hypothetical protein
MGAGSRSHPGGVTSNAPAERLIRDAAELRKLLVLQEENPPGIAMRSWVG